MHEDYAQSCQLSVCWTSPKLSNFSYSKDIFLIELIKVNLVCVFVCVWYVYISPVSGLTSNYSNNSTVF